MPKLDELGKKVFAEETPAATKGALLFHRPQRVPIESAETDGVLLVQRPKELSKLIAPWSLYPEHSPELLVELKMRGDYMTREKFKRALLQRQAWECYRHQLDEHYAQDIPMWIVSATLPGWLSSYTTLTKLSAGCYTVGSGFFPLTWIASNELPLEPSLLPLLLTRDGAHLDEFFRWVARNQHKELSWVEPILGTFSMPKNFLKEISDLYPNDPELKKQWGVLAELALEENPDLADKLNQQALARGKKEGKAEGEHHALQRMLGLKLGRELAPAEENRFDDELKRIGTDGVAQLILASDNKALESWLSSKTVTTKPTKAKK